MVGTGLANDFGAYCRNQTSGTGKYVSTPCTEGGQFTHTIMCLKIQSALGIGSHVPNYWAPVKNVRGNERGKVLLL